MSSLPSADFQRVAALGDVEPGLPLGVMLSDGRRLCLVRDGDMVHAVDDRCPHRDFALSGGDVVSPCILECPWHGARFDVRTGVCVQGPSEGDVIGVYPVLVRDGAVFVGATPVETAENGSRRAAEERGER